MQPTSPTLQVATLDKAIEFAIKEDLDTVISAINSPHLSWGEKNGKKIPNYIERLNRQYLPPCYMETGAFVISKRTVVTPKTRIGEKVDIFEVPEDEAQDVDTFEDLRSVAATLEKQKVAIYVNGNNKRGIEHIYRALEIADEFYSKPHIYYDTNQTDPKVFGITTHEVIPVNGIADLFERCKQEKYTVFINDILTTSIDYIIVLKSVLPDAKIINFEDDDLGTAYPMTNGGKNEVVTDPDGESGKVLQIVHANQSFPKFYVKLKEGMTLGDYTGVTMDMRLNAGQWGTGLRIVINGTTFEFGRNAADYGFDAGQNTWKRGGIYVKFVKEGTYTALGEKVPAGTIEIPNSMKDLTEINEFSLGSASGDWDAYIDNLRFTWEAKPQHIEKTPEEKAEIFTEEMEKWIGGMVYAGVNELNSVKTWNIISNPLDKTENENTFKWSEYLGDEGYARTAVKIARDTVKNVGIELKLFVSQTLNQYDEMGNSADKLIALVNAWEGDNITKIDGYNILLSAVYSKDANFQEGNEAMVTELFDKLGKTGKLVRVSNLNMMVEDTNGNYIATNKMSEEDKAAAVSYMAFIMQEYRKLVPEDKQYGISIANMTETSTGYGLSPWTSNYNRNVMYEGIVKGLTGK